MRDRAQIFPRQRGIFISRCNLLAQLLRFSDVVREIDRFLPTTIIVTDIPPVIGSRRIVGSRPAEKKGETNRLDLR